MRWTWLEPGAVCQFFTSSFTAKSPALSAGMTWSFVGAASLTVGVGAAGSGDATPGVSVTGGAGGFAGGAADPVEGVVATGLAASDAGTGGGGGGGGRLSLPPPHAAKLAETSAIGTRTTARR